MINFELTEPINIIRGFWINQHRSSETTENDEKLRVKHYAILFVKLNYNKAAADQTPKISPS